MPARYIGWALDRNDRARLLELFPPRYPDVVADHVTLAYGVGKSARPPTERAGEVVGVADDGRGVQALVVRIGGDTARPDGGTFHITWSLRPGRRPVESNEVIAARGWTPLATPVPVTLEPRSYPD